MNKSSFWALLLASFFCSGGVEAASLIDDLGIEVELSAPPERIVSLAPSNTELLFALGLGEKVVGVTEVCNFPEQVTQVEKVAGFNVLNLEKIVAASPDLVLASRGNDIEGIRSLREFGINVFSLDIQSLDQLLVAVDRIGNLCAKERAATRLRSELQERIAAVDLRLTTIKSRPRVMWGYWSDPVYTAGPGTMIGDLISRAGGVNVGDAASGTWPQVGLETILVWAPEIIITTYNPVGVDSLAAEVTRLRRTDGWQRVPAVLEGRLYFIEPDLLLRPGPRLVDAYEQVARLIHPSLFPMP